MALLEYFAYEDAEPRKEEIQNYRILARISFRQYIYNKVGYVYQTEKLNQWKYFLDRVDLNFDKVPNGFFSVFREMNGLIVTLIRGSVIVNDKTIPDLSVGINWGKYWKEKKLNSKYGERTPYEHNYPEYYPQSDSNPQPAWAYPDKSLPEFRNWFSFEYIYKKFPKYLIEKVKRQKISQKQHLNILEAVKPKQIEHDKKEK